MEGVAAGAELIFTNHLKDELETCIALNDSTDEVFVSKIRSFPSEDIAKNMPVSSEYHWRQAIAAVISLHSLINRMRIK